MACRAGAFSSARSGHLAGVDVSAAPHDRLPGASRWSFAIGYRARGDLQVGSGARRRRRRHRPSRRSRRCHRGARRRKGPLSRIRPRREPSRGPDRTPWRWHRDRHPRHAGAPQLRIAPQRPRRARHLAVTPSASQSPTPSSPTRCSSRWPGRSKPGSTSPRCGAAPAGPPSGRARRALLPTARPRTSSGSRRARRHGTHERLRRGPTGVAPVSPSELNRCDGRVQRRDRTLTAK